MSTPDTGERAVVAAAVADAKELISQAQPPAAEQLSLLDEAPTVEEMAEAKEQLQRQGLPDGHLDIMREARRSGRRKGSRNRRTDDLAKYLLQFGKHPAITLMELQSAPALALVELSRKRVKRVTRSGNVVEVDEEMSIAEAYSLKARAAAELMPYFESKRPVAVDMTFSGVSDLIIAGVTHSETEMRDLIDAEFMEVPDDGDDDGEESE